MKVVYTDDASEDLDGILSYIASNYPAVYDAFLIRLRSVIARIGIWPDSAQEVAESFLKKAYSEGSIAAQVPTGTQSPSSNAPAAINPDNRPVLKRRPDSP